MRKRRKGNDSEGLPIPQSGMEKPTRGGVAVIMWY